MSYKTRVKTVRSGNRLEIYRYKIPVKYGGSLPLLEPRTKHSAIAEQDKIKNRYLASLRSKKTFTRLVYANVNQWIDVNGKCLNPTFLTLTFKENIKSIKQANLEFTKFIKRLTYKVIGVKASFLKYITAIEFQKRGAIHYHVLFFNLPYTPKKEIEATWDKGFIKVKKAKDIQESISYLCKYMAKELLDDRLRGEKSYFCSRGLVKPEVRRDEKAIDFFTDVHKEDLEKIKEFSKSFKNTYCEEFTFSIYDLEKDENLKKEILAFEKDFTV